MSEEGKNVKKEKLDLQFGQTIMYRLYILNMNKNMFREQIYMS